MNSRRFESNRSRARALAIPIVMLLTGIFAFALASSSAAAADGELPSGLTRSERASIPLNRLEELYLKERCGDACADELSYEYRPNDRLSLAEQLVVNKYTETYRIENLRIFLAAVAKIPATPGVVFRGEAMNANDPYQVGETVVWKRFKSTSGERTVAEGFVKDQLLKINAKNARSIVSYSATGEHELILLPGTRLRVDKVSKVEIDLSYGNEKNMRDVTFVEMTEVPAPAK